MSAVLWVLVSLAVLYLLACLVTAILACRRFPPRRNPMHALTNATDTLLGPYRDVIDAGRDWLLKHPPVPMEMTSYDGLKLRARFYGNPDARGILVACHGYRSSGARDFAPAMGFYHDHGFSILLIDERAAGESEGKYITFGVRESRDIRDWCRLMQERFPDKRVLLAGISMGASAVLMTADDLPENVAAILADCGYDSPWEELRDVARIHVSPAAQILLPGIDLFCRLIAGFGLRERSASDSLSRCRLPVFFIHGEADGLVPFAHSLKNRAACAGPSYLFSVPGADHGISYLIDPDGYRKSVSAFLEDVFAVK